MAELRILAVSFIAVFLMPALVRAGDKDVRETIAKVVAAAGGEERLLKLFRSRERLNVSSDPEKKGSERVSVAEPPGHWWLGTRDRVREDKEPAALLVWAWTLGALVDAKSKVELIPGIEDEEKQAFGLKISETVTPPLEMYFDKETNRMLRIDWRGDIHRFSQWKEADGAAYASKIVGYKKSNGKPWYFAEVLEVERLKELPANLKR